MKDNTQNSGDGLFRQALSAVLIAAGSCVIFLLVISVASTAVARRVSKGPGDDSPSAASVIDKGSPPALKQPPVKFRK